MRIHSLILWYPVSANQRIVAYVAALSHADLAAPRWLLLDFRSLSANLAYDSGVT